ncbi:MAG: PEGA domain-containing protein, partial [Polyangiaceae bacterium]
RRAQELDIAVEVDAVSSPAASAPAVEPPSSPAQVMGPVPSGNPFLESPIAPSASDPSAPDPSAPGAAPTQPTAAPTQPMAASAPVAVPSAPVPTLPVLTAPVPTAPIAATPASAPQASAPSAPMMSGPSVTSGPGPETRAQIDEAAKEFLEETAQAREAEDDFGVWDAPTREVPTTEFEAPTLERPAPVPPGKGTLLLPNLPAPPVAQSPGTTQSAALPPPPAAPRAGMKTQLGLGPVGPGARPPLAATVEAAPALQPIMPLDDYDEADDAPTRVVDAAAVHYPPADVAAQSDLPPVPLAPRAPSFQVQDHHSQPPPQQTSLAPVAAEQITLPPMRQRSVGGWIAAGVLGLAAVVGLLFLVPQTGLAGGGEGELIVTVAGPGQSAVAMPKVLIDGQNRCETSPCRVKDLDPGPHFVRVSAPGFKATTDLAVSVVAGEEAVLRVDMVPDAESVAAKAEKPADESAKPEELAKADEKNSESPADEAKSTADEKPSAAPKSAAAPKPVSGGLPGTGKPAAPTGNATLRISSIPIANVVVDGRPLGSTPKIVKVSPGNHSVVFISPTGRKTRGVKVGAGQTQVVAVKF